MSNKVKIIIAYIISAVLYGITNTLLIFIGIKPGALLSILILIPFIIIPRLLFNKIASSSEDKIKSVDFDAHDELNLPEREENKNLYINSAETKKEAITVTNPPKSKYKTSSKLLSVITICLLITNIISGISLYKANSLIEHSNLTIEKNEKTESKLTKEEYEFLSEIYYNTDWESDYKEYYKENNPNANDMEIIKESAKAKDIFSYIIEKFSQKVNSD